MGHQVAFARMDSGEVSSQQFFPASPVVFVVYFSVSFLVRFFCFDVYFLLGEAAIIAPYPCKLFQINEVFVTALLYCAFVSALSAPFIYYSDHHDLGQVSRLSTGCVGKSPETCREVSLTF